MLPAGSDGTAPTYTRSAGSTALARSGPLMMPAAANWQKLHLSQPKPWSLSAGAEAGACAPWCIGQSAGIAMSISSPAIAGAAGISCAWPCRQSDMVCAATAWNGSQRAANSISARWKRDERMESIVGSQTCDRKTAGRFSAVKATIAPRGLPSVIAPDTLSSSNGEGDAIMLTPGRCAPRVHHMANRKCPALEIRDFPAMGTRIDRWKDVASGRYGHVRSTSR